MSPAVSKKQAKLMQAARHGADFPMAKKVRASMTAKQLEEFSHTAKEGNRYDRLRREK